MTRRLVALAGCFVFCAGMAGFARAASYTLNTGETVEGDPIQFLPQGLLLKKPDGSLPVRIPWTNFNQNALKELAKNPKAKPFVEGLLDVEESEPDAAKKAILEIKPKIPDRLDRPDLKAGLGALFSSGVTLTLLVILYLASIYAGYEIAIFRNFPIALVCPVCAVAPVLGPILVLCLPTRLQKTPEELAAESMAQHVAESEAHAPHHAPTGHESEEAAPPPVPADTGPQSVVYLRGQTTFNRRFFETKFAGFLRMVPGEAEKDMVIYIRSARGEHVGARLSRIQPDELYLQINKGGATSDVMIPFADIMEIQVRPKATAAAPRA